MPTCEGGALLLALCRAGVEFRAGRRLSLAAGAACRELLRRPTASRPPPAACCCTAGARANPLPAPRCWHLSDAGAQRPIEKARAATIP